MSDAISDGIKKLGLKGKNVAVHCSLRSFGKIQDLPMKLIDSLQSEFTTVLMPAFSGAANALPPQSVRPKQNGCDYKIHFDPIQPPPPFQLNEAPIHPKMGMLSQIFSKTPAILRSNHPWHSWIGNGPRADEFLNPHPWTTTNLPLNRLAEADGWVLLFGVTLTSCTAIHLAEEKAGRGPFMRWAVDHALAIQAVRVSGCAKGFDHLMNDCKKIFRKVKIGNSQVIAAPMKPLIEICTEKIKKDPEITRCSQVCLRCHDAVLGGPLLV